MKTIFYIANVRVPTEKAHGVQIMKMCEAFAREGVRVELVVPTRTNPIRDDPFEYYAVDRIFTLTKLAVPDTVRFGKFGFFLQHAIFSLRAALYARRRARDSDIVYSRDAVVLALLGRSKHRAIWEVHDDTKNALSAWCAKRIPRVVAISEGLRVLWNARGIPKERIIVAHDGVDLDEFAVTETKAAARDRLGLPRNAKIAMYVGRLDGWKGAGTFAATAELLAPNIGVVLIGGEDRQVSTMAKQYPMAVFLGFRPYRELHNNQQAADVLVLPNTATHTTGAELTSPLKLFAYMASNIPIVASDVPALREVLDETTAYFAAPDDAKSLADTILRVFADPYASEIAANARNRVAAYTWQERARTILRSAENAAI